MTDGTRVVVTEGVGVLVRVDVTGKGLGAADDTTCVGLDEIDAEKGTSLIGLPVGTGVPVELLGILVGVATGGLETTG